MENLFKEAARVSALNYEKSAGRGYNEKGT